MIDLLILYILSNNREYTMYSIRKRINELFSPYTTPSFGALKPALIKLEDYGCITVRQIMSDGGKLSGYYQITRNGIEHLKSILCENLSENPLQFLSNAKVKISCADILEPEDREKLFFDIKSLAMSFKLEAEKILNSDTLELNFYQKILLDNTACEYKNFITLIEGLEKDNARNSK